MWISILLGIVGIALLSLANGPIVSQIVVVLVKWQVS